MPVYNYVALKNNKEVVKGKIEAENHKEARMIIRGMSLLPTQIVEETKEEKKIVAAKLKKMSLQDKIDFTSTLQILIQSGIPVIEALMFVENDAAKVKLRDIAKELRRQIIAGSTLADTIAKYPKIFGQIYIGLVRAGEDSGELEKTLERLLELQKKEAAIRGKVIGTLMYPVFVMILAVVIVTIMLVFVFPAFKEMFENLGKELPPITAFLMNIGVFLQKYWIMIIVIYVAMGASIYAAFAWQTSKRLIDKYVLKVPLLSSLIEFSNFSNFIAVMQVAYEAGIPIIDCLYLSNITLTNYTLQTKISEATTKVQQGQHLSMALRQVQVMPKMILFMIATGEQSGRLGDMLYQATLFIDKKLDTIIDTLTKMIEPMMLIIIGGIVLVLALALYLPLFSSYTA
ncbi:MAG: type II secretion system F family protein [Candidatus Gastranaerophilaceae bacterium]